MSLNLTKEELYRSILFRAADIYDVDYEDVERDIGQQFDPMIRFMAGALASELERVYQHIHDTEGRLQRRLAKVLLPEYYHLPQPAHALATAKATSDAFIIDETTSFIKEAEDEDHKDIAFSPLFPIRILPAEVRVIATEHQLIDVKNQPRLRRRAGQGKPEEVRKIAIGFEASEPITNWQGASLYFDLKGSSTGDVDKALLLAALSKARCSFHGQKLKVQSGIPENSLILEDYLNGNERLQQIIRARYERHFIGFTDTEIKEVEPSEAPVFLDNWYRQFSTEEGAAKKLIAKLDAKLKEPLYWLELELAKPVEIFHLESRISIRLNVFPVVNRRINGHQKGEHYWLRNNSIKWISLKPEEDFLSIRRVYEEKAPEYTTFTYKPFAEFKEERKPSYTLRYGGVGRWDDFNAWKRLAYVVNVLQDNYKQDELVNEAAAAMSLEDIHHLLGKRISKTAKEEKPTKDIYVLLHAGITSGIRVRAEYWTSVGASANNVSAKSRLKCVSKDKSYFDADSIELISNTVDGKDPLNSTQQLEALKSLLLSRGRIVTREDVKVFCKTFLADKLATVEIKDGVGTDPRYDFGMTRLLEVNLTATKKAMKEDWEGICQQLQELLEQRSTSSIPIKVSLVNPATT